MRFGLALHRGELMEIRDLRSSLRVLSDMARLRIVQYLAGHDDEITVSDLTKALRISQPLASWHLRKLRRAQLVYTHRVGRQVFCSLNRARLGDCLQSLSAWCDRQVAPARQSSSALGKPPEAVVVHHGAGV
jgi:ArsR family transcriptional regulator, arsenate/arsenite/antimonite-responsive transcriptional repressor